MNALRKKELLALSTLFLLAMMSGCMQAEGPDMPGGVRITNIRRPNLTEKDGIIKHFYMETAGDTEFMNGRIELYIDLFDPEDPLLKKRAGEDTEPFEEKGYIFYMVTSYDTYLFPVDKSFMEELTNIVSESNLYSFSGEARWTFGLPEDAGMSSLIIEYESGKRLSHAENGTIADPAQDMVKRVFPLLIETIDANNMSFVSLFNLYHSLATPTEWIKGISMRVWNQDMTNSYYYNVVFNDGENTSSINYQDSKGVPLRDSVVIEKEDAQQFLQLLSEARFSYQLHDGNDAEKKDDFFYLVDFHSGNQHDSSTNPYEARPSYSTGTDTCDELDYYFFYLINKYCNSEG